MAKKKTDDIFYGFILNEHQEKFKEAIMSDEYNVVIADATAGSGKTLLAVACANILCKTDKYKSAVYIFPTVELIDHMENFDGCIECELPISYRGKLAMHIDKL